jgi:pSer/pThr/pTyr-binding forkhead associated (FHA) protein
MANARAKLDGREIELGDGIATCGRSPDNTIEFPEDSNVSRYHADI